MSGSTLTKDKPAPTPKTGSANPFVAITQNLRESGIYIAFVVVVLLFAILTDGLSLSPGNITNIVLQYSYVLVLAIGMLIVIVAGHIDLSVGSVVALTGAVSAQLVIGSSQPWWVGSSRPSASASRSVCGRASGSRSSASRRSSSPSPACCCSVV